MRGKPSGRASSTDRDDVSAGETTPVSLGGVPPTLGNTMSSLSERLPRGPASAPAQVDHARRLVADWQLLADLSFADLTLWVPLKTGGGGGVAQGGPLPAPTSQPDALVGAEASGVVAEPFALAFR